MLPPFWSVSRHSGSILVQPSIGWEGAIGKRTRSRSPHWARMIGKTRQLEKLAGLLLSERWIAGMAIAIRKVDHLLDPRADFRRKSQRIRKA